MSTTSFAWQTASFTGSTLNGVLTVTGPSGTIGIGNTLAGANLPQGLTLTAQLSGSTGGTGTYRFTGPAPLPCYASVGPEAMTTATLYAAGTGTSQNLVAPGNAKQGTIVAFMGASAGNATVQVLGSVDGGTHMVSLGTIQLTGANAVAGFTLPSSETLYYNTIALNVQALSGGQVAGLVRYR